MQVPQRVDPGGGSVSLNPSPPLAGPVSQSPVREETALVHASLDQSGLIQSITQSTVPAIPASRPEDQIPTDSSKDSVQFVSARLLDTVQMQTSCPNVDRVGGEDQVLFVKSTQSQAAKSSQNLNQIPNADPKQS